MIVTGKKDQKFSMSRFAGKLLDLWLLRLTQKDMCIFGCSVKGDLEDKLEKIAGNF